jgi:hypothetical protein
VDPRAARHANDELYVELALKMTRAVENIPTALAKQAIIEAESRAQLELARWITDMANSTSMVHRPAQTHQQIVRTQKQDVVRSLLADTALVDKHIEATTLMRQTYSLTGLGAADFTAFYNRIRADVTRQHELDAQQLFSSYDVEYTLFYEDHPQQFDKLGQTDTFVLNRTNQTVTAPQFATFYLPPPAVADGWRRVYTDVAVYFIGPNGTRVSPDRVTSIVLVKGGESVMFRSDGRLENAMWFQHREVAYTLRYFSDDCSPASAHVMPGGYMTYSPYGEWRVSSASPLDFVPAQIRFVFTLQQGYVPSAAGSLPVFANDLHRPNDSSIIRPDGAVGCALRPRHPNFAPTTAPTSPTAAPTDLPTAAPSSVPTKQPTAVPTAAPTPAPSSVPTEQPAAVPTAVPTPAPSSVPSTAPSLSPTSAPTTALTAGTTLSPTTVLVAAPPSVSTQQPTTAQVAVQASVVASDQSNILLILLAFSVAAVVVLIGIAVWRRSPKPSRADVHFLDGRAPPLDDHGEMAGSRPPLPRAAWAETTL